MPTPHTLLERLRDRREQFVATLAEFVTAESPSADEGLLRRCQDIIAEHGARLLGCEPERVPTGPGHSLRWRFGQPCVLLVAHLDTVWPAGTIRRWPFEVEGNRATGPGVFDMKGGLVQALYAVATLDDAAGVELLVTADEELGSPHSRSLIEQEARGARAALVLEPSLDGALKTERKGASDYRLHITGRSAHAGLEPERGVNATVELAHQVARIVELGRPADGTTVTPTAARAGEVSNQVPAHASVAVDVRASSQDELIRVDRMMRGLRPVLDGAELSTSGGISCQPLNPEPARWLYELARRCCVELGLDEVGQASAGGTSDGNHTAAVGTPTLDGLGAVGGNAHAEGEWLEVSAMPDRAALLSRVLTHLLDDR